jgi:lipopolysaccharide export system protein LptC
MLGAQYHGVDQHGQPYTLTADSADEQGSDEVKLTAPEGDMVLKSGAWLMLKSAMGLFHQKAQLLGLTGDVTLYRNDGTIMTVAAADIDLRGGNAQSRLPVQVQGPFGTLNAANGFKLTDRGADIVFNGPIAMTLTQVK